MTARRGALLTGVGLLMALVPTVAGAQSAPQVSPVVEAARQVTTSPNPVRLHVSPELLVHPADPQTAVVAVGDLRNGGCGLWMTRDGGLSWARTAENLLLEGYDFCSQREFGPGMRGAFASDGTLYVSFGASKIEEGHPNSPVDQLLARTTDLGLTHETFLVAERADYQYDPEEGPTETGYTQNRYASLAVDPEDPNKVYVGWRQGVGGVTAPFGSIPVRSMIAVSGDGGRTWGEAVDVATARTGEQPTQFEGEEIFGSDVPILVAAPNDTVYAFTKERPQRSPDPDAPPAISRLFMFKSTDGGATWTTSEIFEGAETITNPDAAIDPNTGQLYVAFDARIGDSETAPSDVYFTTSSNGGRTWTEPVNITDDDPAKQYNQYFPGISVAPNGRIDVAWWDFRNDPFYVPEAAGGMNAVATERYVDVYMASSSNAGRTWSKNIRVTDRTIDTRIGVTFNNQDVRAPMAVASTNEAAYVAWADSRAGRPDLEAEDTYMTRVRFGAEPSEGIPGESKILWSIIGAGAALALGGLILLIGTRVARREPAGQPQEAVRSRSE